MLIEYRAYTLKPGNLPTFWSAQSMRGYDPSKRPIMARLIGYFTEVYGRTDRIVHFWRFDSYDDWISRLHGSDPSREAYFQVVRPLMLAQENSFLLPAPVPALTPLWGNGKDWLPEDPPPLGTLDEAYVEMTTVQLLPGALTAYWQACRDWHSEPVEGFIGCFYTLVGQQHRVILLRHHKDASFLHASQRDAAAHLALSVDKAATSLVVRRTTSLLRPAPMFPMSPLFQPGQRPGADAGRGDAEVSGLMR